mgnify:FL=1
MKGSKYLSELVDLSMLQKDKLNIIQAPTGSGKTYFALNYIPAVAGDAVHKVVYLIDTINGKEQILKNYNAISEYPKWNVQVSEGGIWFYEDNKVVVITYAKFGALLQKDPSFHRHFDYIICDELHSLINFQYFSPRPNLHSVAKEGLERAVRNDGTVVVALTATPNKIKSEFRAPLVEVPIDQKELIQYGVEETKPYTDLLYLLSSIDPEEIGICYIKRISAMIDLERTARNISLHPVSIWSIKNTDYQMTEEQLAARKSILENHAIPNKYNLLIINSSSETSIKIKSKVDYAIIHSTNKDTQIQVRGRVNNDLKCLYIPVADITEIVVPAEFLNVPLTSAEKTRLCEILNVRNEQGRRYSWPTIKELLIELDYQIIDGRKNNLRVNTIIPPPE